MLVRSQDLGFIKPLTLLKDVGRYVRSFLARNFKFSAVSFLRWASLETKSSFLNFPSGSWILQVAHN